jgi:hypothetical protein
MNIYVVSYVYGGGKLVAGMLARVLKTRVYHKLDAAVDMDEPYHIYYVISPASVVNLSGKVVLVQRDPRDIVASICEDNDAQSAQWCVKAVLTGKYPCKASGAIQDFFSLWNRREVVRTRVEDVALHPIESIGGLLYRLGVEFDVNTLSQLRLEHKPKVAYWRDMFAIGEQSYIQAEIGPLAKRMGYE